MTREIIGHDTAAVSRLYTDIDSPTLQAAMSKMEISQPTMTRAVTLPGAEVIEHLQKPEPEFPALRFRFAKTMASTPHSYVVRSPQNEAEYLRLFYRIAQEGVWEQWKDGRRYQYLYLGGFKYWRIGQIINRAEV